MTLLVRNERRMDIGKTTFCNAEMTYILEDKYFQPYLMPSPVHSLCSKHNSFLVGPVEFLQVLSFSIESLSSDIFHGWLLLTFQVKCHLLSQTVLTTLVCKSLHP